MPESSTPQTLFVGLLLTIMVTFATMAFVWMIRVVRAVADVSPSWVSGFRMCW
jgi:hypothetical protein